MLSPVLNKILGATLFILFAAVGVNAAVTELNRVDEIQFLPSAGPHSVLIKAQKPIGYRYTVYESTDPKRVIIDFRNMSVRDGEILLSPADSPVTKVQASTHELTSGVLTRVEIFGERLEEYKVDITDEELTVNFTKFLTPEAVESTTKTIQSPPVLPANTIDDYKPSETVIDEPVVAKETDRTAPAQQIESGLVTIGRGVGLYKMDKPVSNYKHFVLDAPPRLVVDIFSNKPAFSFRSKATNRGFKKIRIGVENNKTRFVFDANKSVPSYIVSESDGVLSVAWGDATNTALPDENRSEVDAIVESVGFFQESGKSLLTILTSNEVEASSPERNGRIVTFILKGTKIRPSLVRAIDTSSFVSGVNLITPYTTRTLGVNEVRFAIELRGDTSFELKNTGSGYSFLVDDTPFIASANSKEMSSQIDVVGKSIASPVASSENEKMAEALSAPPASNEEDLSGEDESSVDLATVVEAAQNSKKEDSETKQEQSVEENDSAEYVGQKISLVFDNADIHQILQLIADVSQLNIIAKRSEVNGQLSVRLIDVPWDQAFAIVLDLMELEKIQRGNVVRILPKEKAMALARAKWEEIKAKEEREELVDEVITVSYSSLKDVAGPAKNLLSARGSITEDDRSKQLIVTDIPSVITRVKSLVATLDSPEKQVMIEARIVEADSSFGRDLGVSWGVTNTNPGAGGYQPSSISAGLGGTFVITPPAEGTASAAGGLGSDILFGTVGADSTVLDLRISALESSGRGKVVSSPRISTMNGKRALISQGTSIPYQTVEGGEVSIAFVDATLSLEVTPVINPDNSVILDIKATNSSPGSAVGSGVPSINKKEATTQVLVNDGETTVIGGIFVEDEDESEVGVPGLMKFPLLRHLFKSTRKGSSKSELLIFITPRIIIN